VRNLRADGYTIGGAVDEDDEDFRPLKRTKYIAPAPKTALELVEPGAPKDIDGQSLAQIDDIR